MKRYFFFILSVSLLLACSHKKDADTPATAVKFCIPDSLMNQLAFDTVALRPVSRELKLNGKITFDQDKVVRIYPLVSGLVVDVKTTLGAHVEKGQVLAIIRSSEMAGAENDQVTARSNLAVAEKNLAASADLYKSGILSEKEYTAAQKELEKAKSEMQRSSTVLSIYGNENQTDYVVKAPISGFIVEKLVNTNMQIRADNSTNLFTISDLGNVWVVANIYESDIAGIKENEKAEVTTLAYPERVFSGKIDRVYNVLDPDTKTMKVQINLGNHDFQLKPEMFANVLLHQPTQQTMLAVPANSVIFDRNQYWVLVYKDKCKVESRKVEIVSSNSRYSYVRSGVQPGERVIVNRQLLIYSALNQ